MVNHELSDQYLPLDSGSKKAVFCIDNVDTDVTVNDIEQFVVDLSVKVISCHEVKPRRRRNEDRARGDRKAFRLCIPDDDVAALLNDEKWPAYITISHWFFKSSETTTTKKIRSETQPAAASSGAVACVTGADEAGNVDDETNIDDNNDDN